MSSWTVTLAFYYADRAHVNRGVIASLFTSAVVFVTLIFYFVYKERISWIILSGMVVICASVPCVAIKEEEAS